MVGDKRAGLAQMPATLNALAGIVASPGCNFSVTRLY